MAGGLPTAIDALSVNRLFVPAMQGPQNINRTAFLRIVLRTPGPTGFDTRAWRIKKDWLRTGPRVRVLDVMAGLTFDGLLFGNREGTVLANAIWDEALKPFPVWEKGRA